MPLYHMSARSQQNPSYPQRFEVPDEKVPWSAPFPEYQPTPYTFARKDASFADPADPNSIPDLKQRVTYEAGGLQFDPSGTPLNPMGRTGMVERGRLAKWGPNHAADPIVTRYHPTTGELQFVAIKRKDTGEWALPGGMVDAGETVSSTVRREFTEEAGALQDPKLQARFEELTAELFGSGGRVVYRGYVDDPRNTDNAWMETTAFHFHCSKELGAMLPLEAGDDASHVKWVTIDASTKLYASHLQWVETVVQSLTSKMRLHGLVIGAAVIALPLILAVAAGVTVVRMSRARRS